MKKKSKNKFKKLLTNKSLLIGCIVLVVLIIAIVIALFVRSKKLDDNTTDTNTSPEVVETPTVKVVDVNSTSRPYAVMINNINVARSVQAGLSDAYLVYEIIVEGGITRYMALFLDTDTTRIGTIRSARHYYLDYALENDAIYFHNGQSDQALADFKTLDIDHYTVSNPNSGWRESNGLSSEHTLYTSMELLENLSSKARGTRNKDLLLNYSATDIDYNEFGETTDASTIDIVYSGSYKDKYTYDEESKTYLRSVNGKDHVDTNTGETLHVKNVIAYQVKNYDLNDGSGKGRQGLDNIGSGSGYLFSEGKMIEITWEKSSREAQTIYKYKNGEEITVNDGQTWIQIVPYTGSISWE